MCKVSMGKKNLAAVFILSATLLLSCQAQQESGLSGKTPGEPQNNGATDKPIVPVESLEVRKIDASELGESLVSANGFVYYLGDAGIVYRASVYDIENAEPVHQLMEANVFPNSGYSFFSPTVYGDIVMLNEHIGKTTAGSSCSTVILPDGSVKKFDYDIYAYIENDDYHVVMGHAPGMMGGYPYFEICLDNESEFHPIGEEKYYYGKRVIRNNSGGNSMGFVPYVAFIGDTAYVLAQCFSSEDSEERLTGVCSVNVRTGKTKCAVDAEAIQFHLVGDDIFFLGRDFLLYKAKIGDGRIENVSDVRMSDFLAWGGNIYYVPYYPTVVSSPYEWPDEPQDGGIYQLGSNDILIQNGFLGTDFFQYSHTAGEYYVTKIYMEDTGVWQYLVIDKSGGIYTSSNDHDVKFTTVYDGIIWEFV